MSPFKGLSRSNFGLHRFGSRLDGVSRRRFLGGVGAAAMVGLPALEALRARRAGAQAGGSPSRLVCIASGNGMPMSQFNPSTVGLNFALPPILASFANIKGKLNVYTGLGIEEGSANPGDHGAGMPASFTCATPISTGAPRLGISLDQVMAKHVAGQTRIGSLQLALRDGLPEGDGPFSPVFLKNLSWASATEPLAPTIEPRTVFAQLFPGFAPGGPAGGVSDAASLSIRRSRSVLDYVAAERAYLMPALGPTDAQRLDQYFTAAREVEQRLAAAQGDPSTIGVGCAPQAAPGTGLSYPDTLRAMADLSVLALQCDATRAIMLQLGCYRNDHHYGFLDATNDHHALSHDEDGNGSYVKICRWIMDQIAYLGSRMDAVQELDGTLLDNSIIAFNSDCGEGDSHDHKNLPVITVGGAKGNLPTGRHYSFGPNTPCAGLYTTLLNALGVPAQQFGERASGPLALAL